jgi:hypothetical protein
MVFLGFFIEEALAEVTINTPENGKLRKGRSLNFYATNEHSRSFSDQQRMTSAVRRPLVTIDGRQYRSSRNLRSVFFLIEQMS